MSIETVGWRDTFVELKKELETFQESKSVLSLFTHQETTDELVREVIFKFLNPIGEASLSSKLYDPTQLKHEIATMTMKPFYSAAEANFEYEDLMAMKKNGTLFESNIAQIVEKPGKQGSHYFFQGTQLMDDGSRVNSPNISQRNFVIDVGADNLVSTLARPIGVTQVTGTPNTWQGTAGAWSTYANMATDLNIVSSSLTEKNFNIDTSVFFYPKFATRAMNKKRATSGDGLRNAFMEFEDLGVSRERVIALDNIYMETIAGAAPSNAGFDIIGIDLSKVKILDTLKPFVNLYAQNDGRRFPKSTLEVGMGFIPLFMPEYEPTDEKLYKGVSIVRGINGS